jgi:hypothetical protein
MAVVTREGEAMRSVAIEIVAYWNYAAERWEDLSWLDEGQGRLVAHGGKWSHEADAGGG